MNCLIIFFLSCLAHTWWRFLLIKMFSFCSSSKYKQNSKYPWCTENSCERQHNRIVYIRKYFYCKSSDLVENSIYEDC